MENSLDILKRKYKYAANYGFILGGYIAFFFMLDFFLPNNTYVGILTLMGALGTPVLTYYLAKSYRDKGCGGYLNYFQVWGFGTWLFFFAALIMSVFYYLRYELLQPMYTTDAFHQAIQMLEQMKAPQAQIDAMIEIGIPSILNIILIYIWFYIIGGALLFLLISGLIARKPNISTNSDNTYTPYQEKDDTNSNLESKD